MSRTVYLDARRLKQRAEVHEYLSSMLSLPDYYGRNLDALEDCLSEMTDLRLVLMHEKEAALEQTYGSRIVQVLEECGLHCPGVRFEKMTE